MAKKTTKKTAKKVVKKATKKVVKKAAKKATPVKAAKKIPAKKVVKKAPVKKAAKKITPAKAPAPKAAPRTNGVNPYITFKDNCEEAFNFYKSVFGGKFAYVGRFNEMPPQDGMTVSASEGQKIMHISLPISKETILMGSDTTGAFADSTIVGNNFSISINAKSEKEADRLFNGLAAGGNTVMPMSKTFWGAYFGMLVDKFGIQWMVNFDK
jgi:PhnB protein